MRLVVLGRQSLGQLDAMVREMFSQVPNRNVELERIEAPMFIDAQLPMLLKVQPQGTLQQLEVSFQVEDYRDQYQAKPLSYLGNLVGHEGEGSLLSRLKGEGLAESLGAGLGSAWRGGALFTVSVSLTDRGVDEYEQVLQLLFAYLDLLREEGPQGWLYDEQSSMTALGFRFREPQPPISTVMSIANSMHYYADEDVLRGPYLMERFDPALISEALDALRPERAQVVLTAPSVATRRESPYYGVPYAQLGPEAIMLSNWRLEDEAADLRLPSPNPFIPEDVELAPLAADNPERPELRYEGPRARIWFRQAEDFRVPKGVLYASFRSPLASDSAEHVAAASLYTRMVTDALNEFTYPALLAGLGCDFYRHTQGISLRVSGYSDKQPRLLEQLFDAIAAQDFDAARFQRVRDDMLRSLRNSAARRPTSRVTGAMRQALLDTEYSDEALIAALEAMDIAALDDYRQRFWNSARAEALVYGNHGPATVAGVADLLGRLLPQGDGRPAVAPAVLQLASDAAPVLDAALEHEDAVVAWYLQAAEPTLDQRAAMALTAQVIESGFFQQLRTEQQLGYIVGSYAWHQYEVPGLLLLIQSPSHDAATVQQAMARFLADTPQQIDEAQFLRHRTALVNRILKPHENLGERAEFYWQAIAFREWGFDRPQQLAAAVEAIDYQDWQRFFEQQILAAPRSLIGVSAGAGGRLPQGPGMPAFDYLKALREAVGTTYEVDLAPL
jgi:secreted Zn-dependent insulinase-like peptidase